MRPLLLILVAFLVAQPPAGQPDSGVRWELLPTFGDDPTFKPDFNYVAFFPNPDAPDLVPGHDVFVSAPTVGGHFIYEPEDLEEDYGPWREVGGPGAGSYEVVILSTSGALLALSGTHTLRRSTDDGRTWAEVFDQGLVLYQSVLPALRGPDGHGAIVSTSGRHCASLDDGRAGTWTCREAFAGRTYGAAEVPPTDALPEGRTVFAVAGGVVYSDDLGASWRVGAGAYAAGTLEGRSVVRVADPGHPYGGALVAGLTDFSEPDVDRRAVLARSDDGGATWAFLWRYDPSVWGAGTGQVPALWAGPDGALWLSVSGGSGAGPYPGRLLRSTDGGATWVAADDGLGRWREPRESPGAGVKVNAWVPGPDGKLYIGTESGLYRTEGVQYPVAEARQAPEPGSGFALSVAPNPAGGAATVRLSLAAPASVRVTVTDAVGRHVAGVWDGPAQDGQRVAVETAGWPVGVYVVRAVGRDGDSATARLTVVR